MSAAELRAQFLALRGTPDAPKPALHVVPDTAAPIARSAPQQRPQYLTGETDKERAQSLLRLLATLPGWSIKPAREGNPQSVVHESGAHVYAWRARDGRIPLNADAPRAELDGYRFDRAVNDALREAGSSREITVSLEREAGALLADIRRRLLDPLVKAWPEAARMAEAHDRGVKGAHDLASILCQMAEGNADPTPKAIGTRNPNLEQYFRGGGVRVCPHSDESLSVDFLRVSTTPDKAKRIAAILAEKE